MLTVFYDGECAFCCWCVAFIQKRSQPEDFVFYSLKAERDRALFPRFSGTNTIPTDTIIVFDTSNRRTEKFKACLTIARKMRQPWPVIAAVLSIFPRFLGDFGYDLIAKSRPFLSSLVKKSER